ncbi:MAG: MCE family protein [Acidobacteriota bacterium]|nr:MCE family protein [Acidobacteriota bacterium]
MRSFTERNPKIIGTIAVVVASAIVLGVILLNRSVFTPAYTIHARLTNAAGIGKGTEVSLAGVKVGTVRAVHVKGDAVVADLAIDHGVTLPQDTAAQVKVQTVLGVLDVSLEPRTGWAHPLAAGATITDTAIPVEFQDLQNTAGTLLQHSDVAAFNQLLSSLAQVTQGKQVQVSEIISGLGKFTSAIDQRQSQVGTLIDAANQLASTVSSRDSQLGGIVDQLTTVVNGLAQRSSQLNALIVGTDRLATETATLIGQNQPQLQGLLSHLQAVLAVLDKHQEDLAEGVAYLSSAVQGFSSIGYSGPNNAAQNWGNIYANLVGVANGYAVLGNCAALDQALNQVLGPDPLPCDERSGPPVGQSAQPSGPAPGTSGGTETPPTTPGPPGSGPSPSAGSSSSLLQVLDGIAGAV